VLYITNKGSSYGNNDGGLKKFIQMISEENRIGYYVRKVDMAKMGEVLGEVMEVLGLMQELLHPE
jgi:hypothetical protein